MCYSVDGQYKNEHCTFAFVWYAQTWLVAETVLYFSMLVKVQVTLLLSPLSLCR